MLSEKKPAIFYRPNFAKILRNISYYDNIAPTEYKWLHRNRHKAQIDHSC